MNVLVIAPHPDDESLGCGGALCRHVQQGDRISVVFLTSGELGLKHLPREEAWRVREEEAREATSVLGVGRLAFLRHPDWTAGEAIEEVIGSLLEVMGQEKPRLVYLPHEGEWHPDHRLVVPAVLSALDALNMPDVELRAYEVWTPLAHHDHVEDITPFMARKLRAVRCYRSQLEGFRYDRAVKGLNQYRGAMAARCRYAEVFRDARAGGKTS